jgi:hypothetical protein
MNSVLESLLQVVNLSGANQRRADVVLLYDLESSVIFFPEDFRY